MMGKSQSVGMVPNDTIANDIDRLYSTVVECGGMSRSIKADLYGQGAICNVEPQLDREPCLANRIKEIITIAEEVREILMSIRERL